MAKDRDWDGDFRKLANKAAQFDPKKLMQYSGAFISLLAMLLVVFIVKAGMRNVSENECCVWVNYLTGAKTSDDSAGYKIFMPFLQRVYVFDKSPQKFSMEGKNYITRSGGASDFIPFRGKGKKQPMPNRSPELRVRANDGSEFWFQEMVIHYSIIPSMAHVVLDDSGPGDAYKNRWIKSYARSILRDEFGRYSAIDMSSGNKYSVATTEARQRLNDMLKPHGIHVSLIQTPRPSFPAEYEKAIRDRNTAEQEIKRLETLKKQLEKQREQRLAEIDRKKGVALEELLGELEAEKIRAEKAEVLRTKAADAYAIQRKGEGEAFMKGKVRFAEGLREKYLKEVEGLRAKAEALAKQGDIIVRELLAKKLANIVFDLVPYSVDSLPTRVQLERVGGGE